MTARVRPLAWPAAAALLAASFLWIRSLGDLGEQVPRLWLALVPALVGYGLAAWSVLRPAGAGPRPAPGIVLGLALCFRLVLLGAEPGLSPDLYRYLWDGRVWAAGHNPYAYAPQAEALAALRDADWQRIEHREIVTVYPPAAQLLFRVVAELRPTVIALKAALTACDLALLVVLWRLLALRGADCSRLVLYAWHPLPVLEVAGSGHVDVLGVTLMMAAFLWLAGRRRHLAALALAGAVLSKLVPVLCALAFWRHWTPVATGAWRRALDPRTRLPLLWVPLLAAAGYAPFAGAGWPMGSGLRTYAEKWQFNDSLYSVLYGWLRTPGPGWDDEAVRAARWICLALLLAVSLGSTLRWRDPLGIGLAVMGAQLLLSPTVHPWYALWVLPFLVFFPSAAWIAFSWLVLLSYDVLDGYRHEGIWREAGWVRWAEYLPLYALLVWGQVRRRLWAA